MTECLKCGREVEQVIEEPSFTVYVHEREETMVDGYGQVSRIVDACQVEGDVLEETAVQ